MWPHEAQSMDRFAHCRANRAHLTYTEDSITSRDTTLDENAPYIFSFKASNPWRPHPSLFCIAAHLSRQLIEILPQTLIHCHPCVLFPVINCSFTA